MASTHVVYLVKCLMRGGWVEGLPILEETDIDRAWAILEFRALDHYGWALQKFACYRLARRSLEVMTFKAREETVAVDRSDRKHRATIA